MLGSQVSEVRDAEVVVRNADGADETLPNDAVFAMIGREAPLGFFRRSGRRHHGRDRARELGRARRLRRLLHVALPLEGREGDPPLRDSSPPG